MATTPVHSVTYIDGTTNAINTEIDAYTVPGSKMDTVFLHVVSKAAVPLRYRLFISPTGAAHNDEEHMEFWDEQLSSPGSGDSHAYVMAAGAIVRVRSDTIGLKLTINGISQDA